MPFVTEQPPYNLLDRRVENELVPMAVRYGARVCAWSPLAMGMLAGRYADDDTVREGLARRAARRHLRRAGQPDGVEAGNRFAALARERGFEPALLAAAWVEGPAAG